MSESPADLSLLLRMMKQMMTDQTSMRDDLKVTSAMVARLDHTLSAVLDEVRAMHAQHARFGNRLRELETTVNEKLAP